MEEGKKKAIMIAVVVACLVVAVAITISTRSGGGGLESIPAGEMTWVKCGNPDCEAEYRMSKRDYLAYIQEHQKGLNEPPMVCQKCGEESVYRAEKCEKCGIVFFRNSVRDDLPDRCPECGFSKLEDQRKRAIEGK